MQIIQKMAMMKSIAVSIINPLVNGSKIRGK